MQMYHEAVVAGGRMAGPIRAGLLGLAMLAMLAPMHGLAGQQVLTQPTQVITVSRGASALIRTPSNVVRLSIADPDVADADLVSPREVLVNARTVGTTSVLTWDAADRVTIFSIVVTPDIGALRSQIETIFPGVPVTLTASGNAIIVSGTVTDPHVARRILEVLGTAGVTVINNLQAPAARQVLLHVRFAEVNRSVLSTLGTDLRLINPQNLGGALDNLQRFEFETLAEGAVRLLLLGDNGAGLDAIIRALKTQGHFRSLAEPNLVAVEGQPASFLAGGEFPFPVIQGGQSNAVTIQWREFGVRLNFTPTVTNIGTVRLSVAPEVSSLDFANGLTFGGFQIPALLTRRAETTVEMRPGQHLAIAGLLDNSTLTEWQKIPLLGDLPILGTFFRSRSVRDRDTELLVLVTPHIVEPTDMLPALPSGDPATWERSRFLQEAPRMPLPTGVRIVPPPGGN